MHPNDTLTFHDEACWQSQLDNFLSGHLLRGFRKFDAAHVTAQAKLRYIEHVQLDHEHPSLKLFVTLHESIAMLHTCLI